MTELRERLLQTMGGAYDFERELAGAGMSRVFVAVERRFGRRVVVKVLPPELAAGVSAERFEREVGLAARLQQANIVPLLDAGEIDGLPYYTMPWVEGESLRARLDARGAASVAETIATVSDVARALSYAHAHGVVHRDIKPENILLSGHTAVVTDFGIAKAISAARTLAPFETITQVGTSLGTPAYMAPEQAMGDPATDHRADLYALGVVAYELLAGERPFTATSLHELIRAHVTETPPALLARRRDIPVNLAALVMRCLEKDPGHRPSSADELLAALTHLHAATDTDLAIRRTEPRMPARQRALVAGALALVFVAAAVVLWRRDHRPSTALDSMRVLVARPSVADPALRPLADMAQGATARALGQLSNVKVVDAGSATAVRDDDAASEARRAQAGFVVAASLFPQGNDSARVEYRVLDARSGDLLRAIPPIRVARTVNESVWSAALDPLLSTVAIVTFPWLGPSTLPLGAPPRYDATRELLTAMSLGMRPDSSSRSATVARAARASELDSSFVQATLWSAALRSLVRVTAYSPPTRAYIDTVLQIVEPQRDRLSPFETALLEYVVAIRRSDQGAVLSTLRRIQEIAPDVILARELPQVLLDVNRPHEALALLKAARPMRNLEGKPVDPMDSPFNVLTLADLHHYLGDYAAARDDAALLRRMRPDELNSIRYQLAAAAALGDSAAIERLLTEARTTSARPGTYNFFGDLALQTGQELRAHGHDAFGLDVLRRALQWFESRGADEPWRVRLRHAIAYHELRDERRAAAVLAPLLAQDSSNVLFLGLHGRLAAANGDSAEARRVDSALAAMGERIGGSNTLERAFIAVNLGRRDRAVQLLQEAFAQGLGFNLRARLHWFTDTRGMRGYPAFDALLKPQG